MIASKVQAFWNHPAGPKTIHFWAPTFKWGISIANIADFSKPPEKLSYPQQMAVTCTGLIWSRYSMVITPKNWNLFSVNVAMAGTGLYQLSRKISYLFFWMMKKDFVENYQNPLAEGFSASDALMFSITGKFVTEAAVAKE